MSKGIKVILIMLLSILMLVCCSITGWYGYVMLFGNEKVVANTFKVGALTLADGTQENFMEVQYFANKDDSGLECFEIKLNSFVDETKESFISQGYQYTSSNSYTNIGFNYQHNDLHVSDCVGETGALGWKKKWYDCQNSVGVTSDTLVYDYCQLDDDLAWVKSTYPLNLESFFKIQMEDDVFLMQLKGLDTPYGDGHPDLNFDEVRTEHSPWKVDRYHNLYIIYDIQYLFKLLYESVRISELGVNQDVVFPFGNLFNYYESAPDIAGEYNKIETTFTFNGKEQDVEKISSFVQSYYQIRIKTYEYGLQRASDSMFGSVLGNANYNSTGTYASDDYFIGKTVIDCDVHSFDIINDGANNITLTLKDDFIAYYDRFKNSIILNIEIDTDLLESLGYNFVGFAENGLADFKVLRCVKISGDTTEEVRV